jgi:hypothetical protein
MENLEAIREDVSEVVFRRALHCLSEDARTLATVEALRVGDFKQVGECMTRSHASLQEYFEVSTDITHSLLCLTLLYLTSWLGDLLFLPLLLLPLLLLVQLLILIIYGVTSVYTYY